MLQEPTSSNYYYELAKLLIPIFSLVLNLILALISISITIYFFYYKNKKENFEIERRIRLDWFKTLILDNNLKYFHEFFDLVEKEMRRLLQTNNDSLKEIVNESIKELNRNFRVRFIDSLLAVDVSIYDELLKISDDMIDSYTNSIFDSGINLSHQPKFEELVVNKLSKSKTEMTKQLFNFKGE